MPVDEIREMTEFRVATFSWVQCTCILVDIVPDLLKGVDMRGKSHDAHGVAFDEEQ